MFSSIIYLNDDHDHYTYAQGRIDHPPSPTKKEARYLTYAPLIVCETPITRACLNHHDSHEWELDLLYYNSPLKKPPYSELFTTSKELDQPPIVRIPLMETKSDLTTKLVYLM